MRTSIKRVVERLQKLPYDQIMQLMNTVADENSMLDSILESVSIGLVITDGGWKLLVLNKAARRYLHISARTEEPRTESAFLWDLVMESEIAEFLKGCAEQDRTNVSSEFTTSTSGGTVRFVTVSVIPLVRQSAIAGRIIEIEDITEKRNREILLRRMENMAGLTGLAAGMAHEIKNPLGAIGIHIQLIQKAVRKKRGGDGTLPDRKFLEDHLDVVNEEISRLNKLVMDFLFAVRPVNAQLALSDPSALIQNIADFFTPEFRRARVDIAVRQPEKCPRLMIDEKLFREALINILQNAFAAIKERYPECAAAAGEPDGSDRPQRRGEPEAESERAECVGRIEISAAVRYDKYVLTVSDNGCGIPEETMQHIFEPYFTTKVNGTGLGMTTAYKIIKEFSGDIQVKSKKDNGTQFLITLPVPQTDRKLLTERSAEEA